MWRFRRHYATILYLVPEDEIKNYISVYGLRTHGEINGTPVSLAILRELSILQRQLFLLPAEVRDCLCSQQADGGWWQNHHHWLRWSDHGSILSIIPVYVLCCSVVSVLCHAAANVNDRSMTGERDSEVAIRFEDKEMVGHISLSLHFHLAPSLHSLFNSPYRLTVPWMVSRIKLASFPTQFVSTSSSELTASSYYTPPLWV